MSIADSDALLSTLLDPRTVSTTVAIDGGIGTSRAVDVWHNCSSLHALPAALSIVVNGGLTGSDTLSLETVSDPFPFYKHQPSAVSDNAPPFELPFLLGIGTNAVEALDGHATLIVFPRYQDLHTSQ